MSWIMLGYKSIVAHLKNSLPSLYHLTEFNFVLPMSYVQVSVTTSFTSAIWGTEMPVIVRANSSWQAAPCSGTWNGKREKNSNIKATFHRSRNRDERKDGKTDGAWVESNIQWSVCCCFCCIFYSALWILLWLVGGGDGQRGRRKRFPLASSSDQGEWDLQNTETALKCCQIEFEMQTKDSWMTRQDDAQTPTVLAPLCLPFQRLSPPSCSVAVSRQPFK